MPRTALFILALLLTAPAPSQAQPCLATDKACLTAELETLAAAIPEKDWRDQTWRETAKLMAAENNLDKAVALLAKIESPDTKAMTIRGIGMAAADLNLSKEDYGRLFETLRAEADKIEHAPSQAIAITYIGMAQAFAGDNDGAMKTAASMTNPALRNKAYGESAEVQAERGDLESALKSLAAVDDPGYRDKEAFLVTKILADRKLYDSALTATNIIVGPYQKSQALLYILTKQAPVAAENKPESP